MALFILPGLTSASARSGKESYGFNPDINAPRNYDPSAPVIAGPGNDAGAGGCHWTREQAYVGVS